MASGTITPKKDITGTIHSGGTTDHNRLLNRDMDDQHPISAITDLQETIEDLTEKITKALNTKAAGLYYDSAKELAVNAYWYLTSEIDATSKKGTKGSVISGPYNLGQGGGGGSAVERIEVDASVNPPIMIFYFSNGDSVICDITGLLPTYKKDITLGIIDYTLEKDVEKTFTSTTITNLNLTIPNSIGQGFTSMISFKCPEESAISWEIVNKDELTLPLKIFEDGVQLDNLPSLLPNYYYSCFCTCDDLCIYFYIKEIA